MGRDRGAQGDHAGERGGVPDLGTCPKGPPGEVKGGPDVPPVAFPTGGPGLCRGMAGTGGGRLWSAHHAKAVFPDRQKGRGTHCVAGANPRAGGHPGGAGRPEKAVEERGGGHRLEPALPVHLRHTGGHPGEIRAFRPAPPPPQYHAAGDPWGGQVLHQSAGPVPGGGEPCRKLPGAGRGGPAPDGDGKARVWRRLPRHGPADHAQQRERHGDQDHRAGEHDHKQRSGRPSNGDHPGHDPVPHRADRAGTGARAGGTPYDH